MNATIMTTANTTRVKFTFEVEFRLQTLSPVTAATNRTTPCVGVAGFGILDLRR
jgi:hypothetical protein